MSLKNFRCIGPGKILAYLRNDLGKATKSLFIVGPWLDDYFAGEVVRVAPAGLNVRVLVRGKENVTPEAWERTKGAMISFRHKWKDFQGRHLNLVHAKVICIDGQIAYVGSANWYKFSLEQGKEIVLRLRMKDIENLEEEMEQLWDCAADLNLLMETSESGASVIQARDIQSEPKESFAKSGISQEIPDGLDELAIKILKENPGAWVIGPKPKKANWRTVPRNERRRI